MTTLGDVSTGMDARYAAGTAYVSRLIFDEQRGRDLQTTILRLAAPETSSAGLTLDIGCGDGGICRFWPHHNVVGIDVSPVAIEKAKANFPQNTFYASAIEEFNPVENRYKFVQVIAQESIEHWIDVGLGLDHVHDLLVDGGSFVLSTPNRDSLHCRFARKFCREAPYCSSDHIHEFGWKELVSRVEGHGFKWASCSGVYLNPVWTLEDIIGWPLRRLTDSDSEVNQWLSEIGLRMPPEYAFIQVHRFEKL